MSNFKAKMHQILFSAPDPAEGAYSAPPDSLAVFKGPTSKGRDGKGREGEGKRRGGLGRGKEGCPPIGEYGSASDCDK